MPQKKPNLTQRFTSGNRVEIFITETEPELNDAECQWETFPPSEEDIEAYKLLVVPNIFRTMERLKLQKQSSLN